MKVFALEPFYGGSHKTWLDDYIHHSKHSIRCFTLSAKNWKWRMEGAAISLAEQLNQEEKPDAFLVTDMLNVSLFKALLSHKNVPIHLYMHENQLSYPWSKTDPDIELKRDHHYGFINYTSCLVADQIYFNSKYHKSSFLDALKALLQRLPDNRCMSNIEQIERKSSVIPVGIPWKKIQGISANITDKKRTILWNHRWEYDKNPSLFFETLFKLSAEGIEFNLVVLGEKTHKYPSIFDEAKSRLAKHLIHFGYASSKEVYYQYLAKSDLAFITNDQDFFGISVVESIAAGCFPLMPKQLAYPEHLDPIQYADCFYQTEEEMMLKLRKYLSYGVPAINVSAEMEKYDWNKIALRMDDAISNTTFIS